MKNNRKKSKPKFPTCGKACITVSRRALIPLAIFRSFNTVTRIGLKFGDRSDIRTIQKPPWCLKNNQKSRILEHCERSEQCNIQERTSQIEFEFSRPFLFLYWFAKSGAFNSWLLPKLGPFCKQNTDNCTNCLKWDFFQGFSNTVLDSKARISFIFKTLISSTRMKSPTK